MRFLIIILAAILLFTNGCDGTEKKEKLLGNDARLFKETPVWPIAKKILKDDTTGIREFFKNKPELLEYKENTYGKTLLSWTTYSFDYEGSKLLCELGANVNTVAKDGRSPMVYAAADFKSSKLLELLIKYGGDVNFVVKNKSRSIDATPLIAASSTSKANTKLLVENGAGVNFEWVIDDRKHTALGAAFRRGNIDIINYLILEKNANINRPLTIKLNGEPFNVVNGVRDLTFKLGSEEYKKKMKLVEFLMEKGINYWEAPIPKRFYKIYDQEYLDKY